MMDRATKKTQGRVYSLATLLALGGFTLFLAHSVRLAEVPSRSMEPTFVPGDILLVRIDAYRRHAPRRGDIVVFRDKKDDEYLVKRIIGLPNEQVTVWSGVVWVDRKLLVEPYAIGRLVLERPFRLQLRPGEYWVMGDNRDHSSDSRDFGPITMKQFMGRVDSIVWPWARRGRLSGPARRLSRPEATGR